MGTTAPSSWAEIRSTPVEAFKVSQADIFWHFALFLSRVCSISYFFVLIGNKSNTIDTIEI